MTEPIVVVGGGGFGREVIDVIRAINLSTQSRSWDLVGLIDDSLSDINRDRLGVLGVAVLGGLDALLSMRRPVAVAIGVGSPKSRRRIADVLDGAGELTFPSLVHPTAAVGSAVTTGDGVIVCAQASIGTNVRLGRHVHVNPHAVIGHDSVLRDFVSINPNATVSGECLVDDGTLVGAAAVVLQGLHVGGGAVIGASACVVRDVRSASVVTGVPAR